MNDYRPGQSVGDYEVYDSHAEYRYYEARGFTHNPHDGSAIAGNAHLTDKEHDYENDPEKHQGARPHTGRAVEVDNDCRPEREW